MKIIIFILICCFLLLSQPGAPVGGYGGSMVSTATNPNGNVCVVNTAVALLFQSVVYTCQGGTYQVLATGGSGALSAVTAAGATNTIANGNFPQTWNWAQTTDAQDAFKFGETSAATNGTLTNNLANQSLVHAITASGSTAAPLTVEQGALTAVTGPPALQLKSTWNNANLTGEGLLMNITNTNSAAASKLLDIRVGNTPQFTVDKVGSVVTLASVQITAAAPACTGTASGGVCWAEGGNLTNVSGSTLIDANVTTHELAVATNGSNSFGMLERSQPGPVHSTGLAANVSLATLCGATAGSCNTAGLYEVSGYIYSTATCATPGPAVVGPVQLTYTDAAGAKSLVALPMFTSAGGATPSITTITLGNTTAWGQIPAFVIWSTGAAAIQYATTGFVACTTGSATYELDLTVTRLQ